MFYGVLVYHPPICFKHNTPEIGQNVILGECVIESHFGQVVCRNRAYNFKIIIRFMQIISETALYLFIIMHYIDWLRVFCKRLFNVRFLQITCQPWLQLRIENTPLPNRYVSKRNIYKFGWKPLDMVHPAPGAISTKWLSKKDKDRWKNKP